MHNKLIDSDLRCCKYISNLTSCIRENFDLYTHDHTWTLISRLSWFDKWCRNLKMWFRVIANKWITLTVKVPERIRFWHKKVHLSANQSCSCKKSWVVIGWEVYFFMPKLYQNFDGSQFKRFFIFFTKPALYSRWHQQKLFWPKDCCIQWLFAVGSPLSGRHNQSCCTRSCSCCHSECYWARTWVKFEILLM